MRYDVIASLSVQQIQIFLRCYQCKNFSYVAEELGFTPSKISKTIAALEALLDIRLFKRKYHALEPTPAADELFTGWKGVYNEIMYTVFRATDIQNCYSEIVRIGLLETTQFCADYIAFKLESFNAGTIADDISWERRDMHTLPQALNNNEVDIIITWSEEIQFLNSVNTQWKKIFSTPDALFIPRGHALFEKKDICLSDCRRYPFLMLSPITYPHYFRYVNEVCEKSGFEPLIGAICGSTGSAKYNLSLGKGLYIAPSLLCTDWEDEDVRKVELDTKPYTSLVIAWNKMRVTQKMNRIIALITH